MWHHLKLHRRNRVTCHCWNSYGRVRTGRERDSYCPLLPLLFRVSFAYCHDLFLQICPLFCRIAKVLMDAVKKMNEIVSGSRVYHRFAVKVQLCHCLRCHFPVVTPFGLKGGFGYWVKWIWAWGFCRLLGNKGMRAEILFG